MKKKHFSLNLVLAAIAAARTQAQSWPDALTAIGTLFTLPVAPSLCRLSAMNHRANVSAHAPVWQTSETPGAATP